MAMRLPAGIRATVNWGWWPMRASPDDKTGLPLTTFPEVCPWTTGTGAGRGLLARCGSMTMRRGMKIVQLIPAQGWLALYGSLKETEWLWTRPVAALAPIEQEL